jgi:hypothetical protein
MRLLRQEALIFQGRSRRNRKKETDEFEHSGGFENYGVFAGSEFLASWPCWPFRWRAWPELED